MAKLSSISDVLAAYRESRDVEAVDLTPADLDYDTRAVSGIRRQPSDRSRSPENRMRDLGRFQARRAKAQGGAYA